MSAVLADTHVVVWYLFQPSRLSTAADAALSGAVKAGAVIHVSAITPIEVRYLVEKSKLPPSAHSDLMTALTDPSVALELLPIDLTVVRALDRIPRTVVPDLPDRIIAATALAHGIPLVTADRKIRAAPIPTIW